MFSQHRNFHNYTLTLRWCNSTWSCATWCSTSCGNVAWSSLPCSQAWSSARCSTWSFLSEHTRSFRTVDSARGFSTSLFLTAWSFIPTRIGWCFCLVPFFFSWCFLWCCLIPTPSLLFNFKKKNG